MRLDSLAEDPGQGRQPGRIRLTTPPVEATLQRLGHGRPDADGELHQRGSSGTDCPGPGPGAATGAPRRQWPAPRVRRGPAAWARCADGALRGPPRAGAGEARGAAVPPGARGGARRCLAAAGRPSSWARNWRAATASLSSVGAASTAGSVVQRRSATARREALGTWTATASRASASVESSSARAPAWSPLQQSRSRPSQSRVRIGSGIAQPTSRTGPREVTTASTWACTVPDAGGPEPERGGRGVGGPAPHAEHLQGLRRALHGEGRPLGIREHQGSGLQARRGHREQGEALRRRQRMVALGLPARRAPGPRAGRGTATAPSPRRPPPAGERSLPPTARAPAPARDGGPPPPPPAGDRRRPWDPPAARGARGRRRSRETSPRCADPRRHWSPRSPRAPDPPPGARRARSATGAASTPARRARRGSRCARGAPPGRRPPVVSSVASSPAASTREAQAPPRETSAAKRASWSAPADSRCSSGVVSWSSRSASRRSSRATPGRWRSASSRARVRSSSRRCASRLPRPSTASSSSTRCALCSPRCCWPILRSLAAPWRPRCGGALRPGRSRAFLRGRRFPGSGADLGEGLRIPGMADEEGQGVLAGAASARTGAPQPRSCARQVGGDHVGGAYRSPGRSRRGVAPSALRASPDSAGSARRIAGARAAAPPASTSMAARSMPQPLDPGCRDRQARSAPSLHWRPDVARRQRRSTSRCRRRRPGGIRSAPEGLRARAVWVHTARPGSFGPAPEVE